MGNAAASCAPSIICSNGVDVVKVLFSDGRIEIYTRPVKAAELMLENPGHFICDSTHLKVGHRIPGLSADEELERRHRQLYFLLPMEMLYSVLTGEELTSLRHRASKALMKHGSFNFSKIFPVLGDHFCMFPSEAKTSSDVPATATATAGDIAEPVERYSRQRSWTPALETIVEVPSPTHKRRLG